MLWVVHVFLTREEPPQRQITWHTRISTHVLRKQIRAGSTTNDVLDLLSSYGGIEISQAIAMVLKTNNEKTIG